MTNLTKVDQEEIEKMMEEDKDLEWISGKKEEPKEEANYEFELWLSTDGKNTVKVKAFTSEGKRKALKVATDTYDYIVARYGTKPKMWGDVMKKNGEPAKPDKSTCKHANVAYKESKTEKNPGRWFKTCKDCGSFLGWKD